MRQSQETARDFRDIKFFFRIGAAIGAHLFTQGAVVQQPVQPRDKAAFIAGLSE